MDLSKSEIERLIEEAEKAREFSYAPYSRFSVGAALLADSEKIYTGCNVESAAFAATCCAERVAFFKAISAGERNFSGIAIVGGIKGEALQNFCSPCGVCRQTMIEFCKAEDFKIILAKSLKEFEIFTLEDLLPHSFSAKNLN